MNVPYDRRYEGMYLAFIAGLSAFGLVPRATVEIPGSERRLDRILALLRGCRYSFHDLSRVTLDRTPPATPRFNMPFELGLAVALERSGLPHEWFVFEARSHRLAKSLSDLNGTDPYIHGGKAGGVLRSLSNALVRSEHQPTTAQLHEVYGDVREAAAAMKADRSVSLFEARMFKDLVVAARMSAGRRIPSVFLRHARR